MTTRYAPVAAWLAREIGLDTASIGPSSVSVATAGRMEAHRLHDVAAYVALLGQSRVEAQQLIEAIVVPETSFFRDRYPFVALKEWALGEWLPAHPAGVMRLLSMPCSTGEEPFSMAMALLEAGVARFLVEGVDISREALARAERGVYRRNSFRGGMREEIGRFFTERDEGEWRINDEVREHVRFRHANLLDPAFGEGSQRYDVIFCRNLLIYLDAAAQRTVLEKIRDLLAPGGIVGAGHAEAYLFSQFGFQPSGMSMAFCFRAPQAKRPRETKPVRLPVEVPPVRATLPRVVAVPPLSSPVPPMPSMLAQPVAQPGPVRKAPATAVARPPASSLEESQRLADAGAFEPAERLALAYLERQGPSARVFFLLALITEALGREDDATRYYRKALYLEPDHVEALVHLSFLLRKQGNTSGAGQMQRRWERAQQKERSSS